MNFDQWKKVLGEAFLEEGPGRPVYLSATEAELRQVSDQMGLGIADPVQDLQAALQLHSFLSFSEMHLRWERSRSKELPPWLPFLAGTTLVVDRQTQKGSTAFYGPLSEFLGRPRTIRRDEYEATFFAWWRSLKGWLEDEDRHDRQRGFATWGSIPQEGPRSIIGHPYTQVILRREERRQIDDFFVGFDYRSAEPVTARDRALVAQQLVDALRLWVRDRHRVSGRLHRILEGSDAEESESLGYVLLDRLFGETSGGARVGSSAQVIQVVPAYDDYERVLRLVAIAPAWVRARQPVTVPHGDDALREPGDVVAVDVPITSQILIDGVQLNEQPSVRLVGRSRYVMASREWFLWCTVDDALPGEDLFILIQTEEARRLGLRAATDIQGMPAGWAITGPHTLDQIPKGLAAGVAAGSHQLVPRLRGGLLLQGRTYLVGGEPVVALAGYDGAVIVDGQQHACVADTVSLSALDLDAGPHTVQVGGFDLTFETVQSLAPLEPRPQLGRNNAGNVVPVENGVQLVTGAQLYPPVVSAAHPGLIPYVDRFIKLGLPGQVAIVDEPLFAQWARDLGLPHVALEVLARSTYVDGDRLIQLPKWIAWQKSADRWVLAEVPFGASMSGKDDHFNPHLWHHACTQIGADPEVWTLDGQSDERSAVLSRWRNYVASEIAT